MKKLIVLLIAAVLVAGNSFANCENKAANAAFADEKLSIKLKNDGSDEVTVYNAGSGGSYRLQKNVITTIKMEAGDKLYMYDGGKKGKLLLTASADMDGKVQLMSKL
jgi:hypothetical protein